MCLILLAATDRKPGENRSVETNSAATTVWSGPWPRRARPRAGRRPDGRPPRSPRVSVTPRTVPPSRPAPPPGFLPRPWWSRQARPPEATLEHQESVPRRSSSRRAPPPGATLDHPRAVVSTGATTTRLVPVLVVSTGSTTPLVPVLVVS